MLGGILVQPHIDPIKICDYTNNIWGKFIREIYIRCRKPYHKRM